MSDKFSLSIGQAHQLEIALRRNGWTTSDIHYLCEGVVSGHVLHYLRQHRDEAQPFDATSVLDKKITEVITYDYCCNSLRYTQGAVTQLLNALANELHFFEMGEQNVNKLETIRDLTLLTPSQLRRVPRLGVGGVGIIRYVLRNYDLSLKDERQEE